MTRPIQFSQEQSTVELVQLTRTTAGCSAFEWLALAALATLLFGSLIFRSDTLPMQLWDESRNANNALGMALNGHWLAPAYGSYVDHWNTKPPLLIWCIAGLLKLGVAPLWALRLPNILATSATAGMIWATLRFSLRDPIAALAGPALLICSSLYMGFHGARTGDYDAFESLFIVSYVVGLWQVFSDPVKPQWLPAVAAGIFGAVMVKGVAGVLPIPGLIIVMAMSPSRLHSLLKDVRTWVYATLTITLCLGYYLSREFYDPGYVASVIQNELGGRYLKTSDEHHASILYYAKKILLGFEPGGLFSPLVLVTVIGTDPRRRELSLLALAGGLALLVILSTAQTKLPWYATPIVPLLSISVAIGISDGIRAATKRGLSKLFVAGVVLCAFIAMGVLRQYQSMTMTEYDRPWGGSQIQYGPFLAQLKKQHVTPALDIIDSGFATSSGDVNYNPIIDFYTAFYAPTWSIARVRLGAKLTDGSLVLTCDPVVEDWLRKNYSTQTAISDGKYCTVSRVTRSATT